VKVNVRLIAATNTHLEDAIAAGTFREDLLYRLNVFTIFVPPLRERKTDVLLLADHFLERLARDHRKRIRRISTPAIDMLMAYHWPGNVRELQNVIERAVLVCDGDVVHAHHPAADAPDGGHERRGGLPVADRVARGVRKGRHPGRAEDGARQPGEGGPAAPGHPRMVNYKIRKYRIDWRRFNRTS
jgi:Nif-specific regulatory protein